MHIFFKSLAAICLLGACATATVPLEAEEQATNVQPATDSVVGLPPQKLAPNECGLFLWSKTDASQFVFFTRAGESDALFLMEGEPTKLQTISEGGEIFGQFFTETVYNTQSGRRVSLSYQPGVDLKDGARISDGIIQFADGNSWRTVLPVLGVRVCQPAISANKDVQIPLEAE